MTMQCELVAIQLMDILIPQHDRKKRIHRYVQF